MQILDIPAAYHRLREGGHSILALRTRTIVANLITTKRFIQLWPLATRGQMRLKGGGSGHNTPERKPLSLGF